jgi:hypothetical protein
MKRLLLFFCFSALASGQFTNATKLRGRPLCNPFAVTDGYALVWSASGGCLQLSVTVPGVVGSSGQIPWNNGSGAYGADSGLAYNSSSKSLGIIGTISTGQAGTGTGAIAFHGLTSGTVTLKPADAGADATLTAPNVTGTLRVTIATGTATLGTDAISANTCASAVTVTATGAATTDRIDWTPNADISGTTGYGAASTDGLAVYPYPTSGNVNFKVCNKTGTSITPGAVTLNWSVSR